MRPISKPKWRTIEMHRSKRRLIHNNRGFTLLEALFSMSVFLLLSHILLIVLFWIHQMNITHFTNEETAWELFVYDIQQLFTNVQEVKLSSESSTLELSYTNSSEVKKINQSSDVLRLLINNHGNTPLLVGIQNVRFDWDGRFITISVIFINGIEKERRFFVQTNP